MEPTKHTFSVLAFTRASRSNTKGELPIYLRITVDGQRAEISTKQYVETYKWNNQRGRIKGNSEPARIINLNLETWERKVREYYNGLLEKNKHISATVLKNLVLGLEEKHNTFLWLFAKHTHEAKALVGIEYAAGTAKNYVSTLKHLRKFVPKVYRRDDLLLRELDYNFIAGFETFLRIDCKNSQNGALKHIQRVKKVTNLAIKMGFLERDPFMSYNAAKEKVNREYLTEQELSTIENINLSLERLKSARDVFIFICYTGLSYSDLVNLTEDNIREGIDGDPWLFTERNKIATASNIPLLPPAISILERYKGHPEAERKGRLLPVISNQKMNQYLKEIAA